MYCMLKQMFGDADRKPKAELLEVCMHAEIIEDRIEKMKEESRQDNERATGLLHSNSEYS